MNHINASLQPEQTYFHRIHCMSLLWDYAVRRADNEFSGHKTSAAQPTHTIFCTANASRVVDGETR